MKKLFVTILLFLAGTSYAGQKAITDTGEEVILNSDGTWEYFEKAKKATNIIETNEKEFKKPANSLFLLKSTRNNSAYWINTDKWVFKKAKNGSSAEYTFKLKGKDVYGTAINEELLIPLESLGNIALTNAQEVAPDAKVLKQEFRIVNGNKVLYMEISGTIKGLEFTYLGHYYSDASGTTQLVAYTGTSLVARYKSEIIDFLNGLAEQ